MKFSLLINMKMPTTVGIFIFISREIFMLCYVKHKEFAIFLLTDLYETVGPSVVCLSG